MYVRTYGKNQHSLEKETDRSQHIYPLFFIGDEK